MEFVSYETAKKLKEAGFPQPDEYQSGQLWYDGGNLTVCVSAKNKLFSDIGGDSDNWLSPNTGVSGIYAPTATDILKEFDFAWHLVYNKGIWTIEKWIVSGELMRFAPDTFENPNPAEAAAEAWLKLSEELTKEALMRDIFNKPKPQRTTKTETTSERRP